MARGFQLHQYLCVATNWKKANQGFTWFYHCQVYGTTHATAFHGEVVQKCTKLIKNLPTMGCSMGISQYPSFSQCYWTMSEATVVQLHLQQPSGSTKLDDLRKKTNQKCCKYSSISNKYKLLDSDLQQNHPVSRKDSNRVPAPSLFLKRRKPETMTSRNQDSLVVSE